MEARHPTLDDMITSILAKLELTHLSELDASQQQVIAAHLIEETTTLDLSIAKTILFRATHHDIFKTEDARNLIASAFEKINYEHLPDHCTVANIKHYEKTHTQAVTDLLTKPDVLLAWLEEASALDIGELFETYFAPKGNHYLTIRELAKREYQSNAPGKAMLCYLLMLPSLPDKESLPDIEKAIQAHKKFKRCAKSVYIKIHADRTMIEKSKNCFINLNRVNLTNIDYANLNLTGAFINRSILCNSNLSKACLFQARLNESDLSSATLSHANLKFATLHRAILINAILDYADLYQTDLSNADLTRANLCKANLQLTNLNGATLTNAMFLMPSDLQHIDLLKAELDRLEKMLADHQFLSALQEAIANDLINNIRSTVAPELIKALLETALKHSFFAHHQNNHYLKETVNVVTSLYYAASTRLFSLMGNSAQKTEETKPTHETYALTLLREEFTRQTKAPTELQRPPPPNTAPAIPVRK